MENESQADSRIECHSGNEKAFKPAAGDIVLFDRVFNNMKHDYIGIVLENYDDYIITAEGNVENVSRILERKKTFKFVRIFVFLIIIRIKATFCWRRRYKRG